MVVHRILSRELFKNKWHTFSARLFYQIWLQNWSQGKINFWKASVGCRDPKSSGSVGHYQKEGNRLEINLSAEGLQLQPLSESGILCIWSSELSEKSCIGIPPLFIRFWLKSLEWGKSLRKFRRNRRTTGVARGSSTTYSADLSSCEFFYSQDWKATSKVVMLDTRGRLVKYFLKW